MDSSVNDVLEDMIDDVDPVQEDAVKPRGLDADAILDTIVPSSVDWKDTVRNHPVMSVAGVGVVGFLVGRARGSMIVSGLTAALSTAMTRQLSDVFEGDFFDL